MNYATCELIRSRWIGHDGYENLPFGDILIGGAPRSGTTLLQGIFSVDENVNPLVGEISPFRFLINSYHSTRHNVEVNLGKLFDDLTEVDRLYDDFFKRFSSFLKKKFVCSRLVLKEPELTKSFPLLSLISKDWVYVVLVRDPRATIASMRKWGNRIKEDMEHPFRDGTIEELARMYNSFYMPLMRSKEDNFWSRVCFVRYEDLVLDLPTQLGYLGKELSVDLRRYQTGDEWRRSRIDFEQERQNGNYSITKHYGKPVTDVSLKAYRKILKPDEIDIIEKRCYLMMRYFKYENIHQNKE